MISVALSLGLLLGAPQGEGDKKPIKPVRKPAVAKPLAPKAAAKYPAFTPERETAALAFVQKHHSELATVLRGLKGMNQEQYETAIREIFHVSETLTHMSSKNPAQYAFALEAWKLKSRIELVAARLTTETDPEREKLLKQLLAAQQDLQLKQREAERERLKQQLTRVETDIERIKREKDQVVDRQFKRLLKAREQAARANR